MLYCLSCHWKCCNDCKYLCIFEESCVRATQIYLLSYKFFYLQIIVLLGMAIEIGSMLVLTNMVSKGLIDKFCYFSIWLLTTSIWISMWSLDSKPK
jgi:hypothetical protein